MAYTVLGTAPGNKWPPQNTGIFAPGSCFLCCEPTVDVDLFETALQATSAEQTALMCGFPGYRADTSVIQRFYKTATWSGTIEYTYYDACEGDVIGSASYSIGGSATWGTPSGPAYCELTADTLSQNGDYSGYGSGLGALLEGSSDSYSFAQGTTSSITGNGTCQPYGTGGAFALSATGALTEILSDEDTLDDAIDRVDASEWSTYSASNNDQPAVWQTQDPATTYDHVFYSNSKWQYTKTGLTPFGHYQVDVEIWRKAFDLSFRTDPTGFTLYATASVTGYADFLGKLVVQAAVPNDVGFVTYAKSDTALVTAI